MPSNLRDRYTACPQHDAYADNTGHRSKRFDTPHTSTPFRFYTTLSRLSTILRDNQTDPEHILVSAVEVLKKEDILF